MLNDSAKYLHLELLSYLQRNGGEIWKKLAESFDVAKLCRQIFRTIFQTANF